MIPDGRLPVAPVADVAPPLQPEQRRRAIVAWTIFLTLDTLVQLAFKAGGQALTGIEFGARWFEVAAATPAVWLALTGYIVLFIVWMVILQGSELTKAFTLTGIAFITVPLGGWLVFGETMTVTQVLGILAIMAGVTLITRPQR